MNLQILAGYTGNGVESRTTRANKTMAVFSVATNDGYMDRHTGEWHDNTTWHRIVVFREKLALYLMERISKGTLVLVRGRLNVSTYVDKEGITRTRAETIADCVTVLRRKAATNSTYEPPSQGLEEGTRSFQHDPKVSPEDAQRLIGGDDGEA